MPVFSHYAREYSEYVSEGEIKKKDIYKYEFSTAKGALVASSFTEQ